MHSRRLFGCGAFLIAVLLGQTAWAQDSNFSISAGYSHLFGAHSNGSNGTFFNRDGAYVDADFAWALPDRRVPLLVGFGLTGSGYYQREDSGLDYYDDYSGYDQGPARLYSDVGLFEFEPRVTLPLWSTAVRGLFLKPRLGAGLLIDSYSIDQAYSNSDGNDYIETHYHTGAAFELRPAVQAGYSWGPGSVGVEVSYMPAWGDFGRLASTSVQEFRAGVFYTFTF